MNPEINEILQGKENFNNGFFSSSAKEILRKRKELLILVRYPGRAGDRRYYLFKKEEELNKFYTILEPKFALTIIKEYKKIKDGIVTPLFIDDLLHIAKESNDEIDWLVVTNQYHFIVCDENEIIEEIREEINQEIHVFIDPNWFDEDITIHAYIPDYDGIVRPGSY